MDNMRRKVIGTGTAALVAASVPGSLVFAQGAPIKIGMSMPQTGGLGAGGQAALIGIRMWVDDVNAKGGLLGRKVEFIVYDDQSNGANTPGIYTKLLDVDKVDILIAPYATNPTAPIMPLVKERGKLLMGNFSFQVNSKVQHDMWFNNAPWNDARGWSEGFLEAGKNAGAKSLAVFAADAEFQQNLANGAREIAQSSGWNIVYNQNYPGNNTDFSSIIRSVRAARPEAVFVACYPNEAVAIMRSVNEIGIGSQVQIFGGGMVGLQFTPVMQSLGSLLNGVVNFNSYVPGMKFPGIDDFFKRYTERAIAAKVDPLGYYLPPFNYAIGQMIEQAVNATKTIDNKRLADYMRRTEFSTIVGPIGFDKNGERAKPRLVQTQFRNVKDNDLEQFRSPGKQVVVWPAVDKQGDIITPFDRARKAT
jgi:branched-chain amino acid transport system substrate-binding protein